MPVTDCVFNKRTGRPCYLLAMKITNGEFIFFIFGDRTKSFQSRLFQIFSLIRVLAGTHKGLAIVML